WLPHHGRRCRFQAEFVMKRSLPPLIVSVALFVIWLACLGRQALEYRQEPIIVSRAQLLAAQYDVAADLTTGADGNPATVATVKDVLFAVDANGPKTGQGIDIANLNACAGFVGPGSYVLPLAKHGQTYYVAAHPLDPGGVRMFAPTIYPFTN